MSTTMSMPNNAVAVKSSVAREPLLQKACDEPGRSGFPWVETAGFGYLTFSSGMAVYRSRGDSWTVAFVGFAYLDLLLLLLCLRQYEKTEPGSPLRRRLKALVWILMAALTLVFAYKVAAVMPAAAAAVVWVLAIAVAAAGFVAFFCVEQM
ncbi:hypothetical protein PR202_gb06607 [Eleusine coracana subsp. coracana]|uniref:Uncharacterized protein n=1 Tax=Eleusine coracana subsp. coracana TaxID=191504 RepID=A0AAV5E9W1_ELECO|nr:hypothetical protein QOZ80_2BG0159680 [Eleusine coracana subsp. coracana]GJN19340.1 hypothetical protein PR202_gb06607 [Eleusine coracana subsp. coracana]